METHIGKTSPRLGRRALAAALLVGASLAGTAMGTAAAASGTPPDTSTMTPAQVQAELQSLQAQVAALKARQRQTEDDVQSAAQVKAIVEEVLKNSQTQEQSTGNQLQAGYDNGFYIRTANKAFNLTINGYLQFRYSYAGAEGHAPNTNYNTSGFNFRRARLILSGNAFKNFIYCISGDFQTGISGATVGNNNAFAILDTWAGYKFSPAFIIRAGSMLVPFTHVEYFSSGTEFPDFAVCEAPFDPVRSDAVDLEGAIIPHTFNYEIQINNGSTSQDNGNVGPGGHFGNRPAVYGRINFAGAGKISDFNDSPDIEWHKHLAWLIGAAAGYESQNPFASFTPGSTTAPAGIGTLNGNLTRFTVDAHAKYRGFAFNSALYAQNIDAAPAPAPGSNLVGTGHSSLFETGYYLEGGYFLVPHKWEIAGRYGELLYNRTNQHQYEGTLGLNYYIFGENAKIQTAVTYVQNAQYTNSNLGTTAGSNDWIGQIQFQFKF
ncbi:MAG: porin [Planctomycetia bacterium]|nr:porin [Planctomycetia bacterium]